QEDRRQDEEDAGDDPARHAMEQPPDVDRELRRLRPGEQHAVVERVKEPLLANPAPPLDQLAMHDGDLTGRAAERDEAELEPEAERPGEGELARLGERRSRRHGRSARKHSYRSSNRSLARASRPASSRSAAAPATRRSMPAVSSRPYLESFRSMSWTISAMGRNAASSSENRSIRTSKVQWSASWVNSASYMSNRISPRAGR